MKLAVYPGSFDPPTNGHIDIITRASQLFDRVIVAITDNPNKKPFFNIEERKRMLIASLKNIRSVEVDSFTGLLINYLGKKKARIIIRGLRAVSDFEYEFQLALMNRKLSKNIETVFLMPDEKYTFLSSSMVKEVALLGGGIKDFVPSIVERNIKQKIKNGQ
ncbi:MAG: pantetheine-phosphate adenylyltransferase [Elusimicrobia bacterium]|nr:pantetheine-phosphate adenylyltransferase [Elusimicrobiota bacterium]